MLQCMKTQFEDCNSAAQRTGYVLKLCLVPYQCLFISRYHKLIDRVDDIAITPIGFFPLPLHINLCFFPAVCEFVGLVGHSSLNFL
jgi:hypothetical protein